MNNLPKYILKLNGEKKSEYLDLPRELKSG